MTILNVYKKFRKSVLLVLVVVELVLSMFIYMDSTAYFGIYDIFEIFVTFALVFYVFMLSNDLEEYEDNEIKESFLSLAGPVTLIYISQVGQLTVLKGSLEAVGLPQGLDAHQMKSFFSAKEWAKIEAMVAKRNSKAASSGAISFSSGSHLRHLKYVAQIVKRHGLDGLLVWFIDLSEMKSEELELTKLFHKYRVMGYELELILSTIPIPVWKWDYSGKIIFYNKAYEELLKNMGYSNFHRGIHRIDEALYDPLQNAAGSQSSNMRKVLIINNQPVVLRINSLSLPGEGGVGYCTTINDIDHLEKKVASLSNTLENLIQINENALLVIDNLGNVSFYNQAFIDTFDLDKESLSAGLTFSSLVDKMRERGRLPEMKDYKEFKWQQMKYITEHTSAESSYMYLPGGITLKASIIPVQGGDTIFCYENISEQLTIERARNEHISVVKHIVASSRTATAIFAQNGRLQFFNDEFIRLFGFTIPLEQVHFMDVLGEQQKVFRSMKAYQSYSATLVSVINSRTSASLSFHLKSNAEIVVKIEALPDNSVMLKYLPANSELAIRSTNL